MTDWVLSIDAGKTVVGNTYIAVDLSGYSRTVSLFFSYYKEHHRIWEEMQSSVMGQLHRSGLQARIPECPKEEWFQLLLEVTKRESNTLGLGEF